MKHFRQVLALILCLGICLSAGILTAFAVDTQVEEVGASAGITVHYYYEGGTPYIYYWNALPKNLETSYPGVKMTKDTASGTNWYKYTFSTSTKINLMFTDGTSDLDGQLTGELTRNSGDWYYKNNRWSTTPAPVQTDRGDFREETIYFVITTRFYDGDTGNNVHCWDDAKANNPDSDPAWRGDFKGLIDKLDYIKALGFSAIWITPVVTNASGYDYHGYHAMDFSTVDVRYESDGATYQDLINAAHEKDIKIVQDVVWNHTGNFGETNLCAMFTKEYDTIQDLGSTSSMKVIEGSELDKSYPNYDSLEGGAQFQARLDILQSIHNSGHNMNEAYHRETAGGGWGQPLEQYASIEGDCRDLNTENPEVAEYINQVYTEYVEMGVDAFRLDTEKHINRWTLNSAYFPAYEKYENFYIFGEVCARWSEYINEGGLSDSPFFYTWAETDSKWKSNWGTNFSDWETNFANSKNHYSQYNTRSLAETSKNAFLNGINYHTPDYSKANGTGVIDFTMHWNFENANKAFNTALGEDAAFNDSTWNVVYVDSHDYGPDACQKVRYNFGTGAWAENMCLMFTFRGIPCVYYGSEVEFQKGMTIDVGPNAPLSTTGRAYFGDYLEGSVNATDFSEYTASGKVAETLKSPLAKHLSKLNAIRRAIPALQKGQYTTDSNYVSGNMAYIRRYTNSAEGIDSLALVTVTDGATFKGIPNGKYIDAVTGDVKNVTNGTLSVSSTGKGNMRVYVCCASGFTGISGAVGPSGQTYLK